MEVLSLPDAQWMASVGAGFERIVARLLDQRGARDVQAMGGAVLFRMRDALDAPYINNLFRVLHAVPGGDPVACAQALLDVRRPLLSRAQLPHGRTFRVVVMQNGKLCPLPPALMKALENRLARESGFEPYRANPDIEIWLNVRSEGRALLLARMRKHRPFDKTLAPGELRPDIARIMAEAADPRGGRAIDPFAGSGALARQLLACGARQVTAIDIDPRAAHALRETFRGEPRMRVREGDAFQIEVPRVEALVTDPPWGLFEQLPIPPAQFYAELARALPRWLLPGGRFVVLTACREAWEAALRAQELYVHTLCYSVLIGGKKAGLYVGTLPE